MNIKKILLIILFLGFAVGAGYLLYRLFFAAPAVPPEVTPEVTPPSTGLPSAGTGAPTGGAPTTGGPGGLPTAAPASPFAAGGRTQTTAVVGGTVAPASTTIAGGSLAFLSESDGKFYRRGADGSMQSLSNATFFGASNVVWSAKSDKAVIEFPDETKVIYDFAKQRQVTIPKHWQDFSFTSDGSQIAAKAIGQDPQNRWLIMANTDGTSAKLIEPLGNNADKLVVSVSPDNTILGFSDTGGALGFDTREMLVVGQNGENFKSLQVDGFGFVPQWSPDGEHLLYSAASQADDFKPTLWIAVAKGDQIGAGRTKIQLNTWADKCTFSDSVTLFCAVPDSLPTGVGLQREIARTIPDSIFRVDLQSGGVTLLGRPEQDTTIETLTVAPDGSALFFADTTGALSEMRLR